jgi:hypothetical protein
VPSGIELEAAPRREEIAESRDAVSARMMRQFEVPGIDDAVGSERR